MIGWTFAAPLPPKLRPMVLLNKNVIRMIKQRMRLARHVAHMRGRRGAYSALLEKPEKKIQRGRHRRKWEDDIKMELQKEGLEAMN